MKKKQASAGKKLWSSRFASEPSSRLLDFTESVSFDTRLALHDIRGSLAHSAMLVRQGINPAADGRKIAAGLNAIGQDIREGRFVFRKDLEDVHMNIEVELIRRIGPAGGRVHTGRSRNDQIAVDTRLWLKESIRDILGVLEGFVGAVTDKAEEAGDLVMPGYTHLQQAQPVLAGHYLLAHAQALLRDRDLFRQALEKTDFLPLGVGAFAGVNYANDRSWLAKELGFSGVTQNSMDTVADRDYQAFFLFACALCQTHLSRFAEDLIIFNTAEFGFVVLDDAYTTGSSIMPNKKNPDILELVRGRAARVIADLNGLLVLLKGLPLTYNRDLQEDKPLLFHAADTVRQCLDLFRSVIETMVFDRKALTGAMRKTFMLATDVADYLVKKGLPFREAHHISGGIVAECIRNERNLTDLSVEDFRKFHSLFGADIVTIMDYQHSVRMKRSAGSTHPDEVKKQILAVRRVLGKEPSGTERKKSRKSRKSRKV